MYCLSKSLSIKKFYSPLNSYENSQMKRGHYVFIKYDFTIPQNPSHFKHITTQLFISHSKRTTYLTSVTSKTCMETWTKRINEPPRPSPYDRLAIAACGGVDEGGGAQVKGATGGMAPRQTPHTWRDCTHVSGRAQRTAVRELGALNCRRYNDRYIISHG